MVSPVAENAVSPSAMAMRSLQLPRLLEGAEALVSQAMKAPMRVGYLSAVFRTVAPPRETPTTAAARETRKVSRICIISAARTSSVMGSVLPT